MLMFARFRWVACQLDALEKCLDPRSLQEALSDLPETLDQTYARMIKILPKEHMESAIRILQFLTYSQRPLRLEEAVDIIAVEVGGAGDYGFNPDDRMPKPQEITRYCSSLVVCVSRKYLFNKVVKELQLAHFSVKDYLTSNRLEGDMAIHFDERKARGSMAEICLIYLLQCEKRMLTKRHCPFSVFAANHWMNHAEVGQFANNRVVLLGTTLLSSPSSIKYWNGVRKWKPLEELDLDTGFCYASYYGLELCIKAMIDINAQEGELDGYYGNALQVASYKGNADVVRILLKAGANPNMNKHGGYHGSALQAASYEGHTDVVRILRDAGADINIQGGAYGNALQAASICGRVEVVRILLKAEANVNAQSGRGSNALQAASDEGNVEVVKMLIGAGANVNTQGGVYGNALQVASCKGNVEAVKMLLKAGVNVNAQGGNFGNALQAALYGWNFKIVKILLKAGANVNALDGKYGNTLQAALYGGNAKAVKICWRPART